VKHLFAFKPFAASAIALAAIVGLSSCQTPEPTATETTEIAEAVDGTAEIASEVDTQEANTS
jgi:hypothetical protein